MKTTKKKVEKKQIAEIHIYVHQNNPSGIGGIGGYTQPRCTCLDYKPQVGTYTPCPIHPISNPNITLC